MHDIPLTNESDLQILMHRDSHFGKNFAIMLDYYEKEGVGCHPDIDIKRIREMQKMEETLGEDLSEKLLPDYERERVNKMRKLYQDLRDNYKKGDRLLELLFNLLLSEGEDPKQEIDALARVATAAPLIDLLGSETFYDPLSPGYGRAPMLAARTLAKIQDPKAILPLFISLRHEDFFYEEDILSTLCSFGEQAKTFLTKVAGQKPLSIDNETAARALSYFSAEPDVIDHALTLLKDPEIGASHALASYLISIAAGKKEELAKLLNLNTIPSDLKEEIKYIIN